MNFLVVDDNRILNRFLVTYLREKGHAATSLIDSTVVAGWLELHPCDALILDIKMPQLDGISLIAIIREKSPTLPIIVFTGLGYDESTMTAASEAGANDYVAKGLGPSRIYGALIEVLARTRVKTSPADGHPGDPRAPSKAKPLA